jgi:hypothetical protein
MELAQLSHHSVVCSRAASTSKAGGSLRCEGYHVSVRSTESPADTSKATPWWWLVAVSSGPRTTTASGPATATSRGSPSSSLRIQGSAVA